MSSTAVVIGALRVKLSYEYQQTVNQAYPVSLPVGPCKTIYCNSHGLEVGHQLLEFVGLPPPPPLTHPDKAE